MLSLPNDGRCPALDLIPEQRRQRPLDALAAQLPELARQQPVLVIGHRDIVTVVGHAATIAAGEWITASGEWVNDPVASTIGTLARRSRRPEFHALICTSAPDSQKVLPEFPSPL
jgi:hypothetical protein